MDFDKIMNHFDAKQRVKEVGWDGFLNDFQEEFGEYDLYSCSTYWENDSQYICKCRGGNGDIIIGWEGVHDYD